MMYFKTGTIYKILSTSRVFASKHLYLYHMTKTGARFNMTNNNLEIIILGSGTSQGVPVVGCSCFVCASKNSCDKRLRTSILIRNKENTIVIDAGPDFRQQMLREKVGKLDAVVVTHNHKDHTGGLDDVRAFNWIQKKPMDIYARDSVLKAIKKDYSYAFDENRYPGVPAINLHEIDGRPFTIGTMKLIPIDAMHHQMPVYGFRINDFSYLTDANYIEEAELNKMKDSKVVILNALRKEKHISHFNLEEAISIIQYLGPERAYITHISHQMGLYKDIRKELPDNIFLACDGDKIII